MSDLFAALQTTAREHGQRPALVGTDYSLCYQDLPAAVERYAARLREQAVRVLALDLDNGVDWVVWDLAALQAGVVCVPIAPFFNAEQRRHVAQNAGVDALVDQQGLRKIPGIAVPLPATTAKITYTSGTTAAPKGVCLSQTALEQVARSLVGLLGKYARRHLAVLPLAVLLENIAGVYAALYAGATVHLPPSTELGPEPTKLWQRLTESRASTAILVPELLHGLVDSGLIKADTELRFVAVGGAKVAPGLLRRARNLGLPVYEGYGLSECASVVAVNTPDCDQPGTVGKVLPHIDLHIENGEIVIEPAPFLGYLGETRNSRLASGDLGSFDADGFLRIDGRRKNVLITSHGRNISPEWIESVLLAQAEIGQALVYGDAEARLKALLVPAAQTVTDTDLTAAVATANADLPGYAHVGQWRKAAPFTPANGLATGAGKLRRQAILELYCNHSMETPL